jgi:hypothetical protein
MKQLILASWLAFLILPGCSSNREATTQAAREHKLLSPQRRREVFSAPLRFTGKKPPFTENLL